MNRLTVAALVILVTVGVVAVIAVQLGDRDRAGPDAPDPEAGPETESSGNGSVPSQEGQFVDVEWPLVTAERIDLLPPDSVAPVPPEGGGPSATPEQFAPADTDAQATLPPPTQWWTSAVIGPGSEPLWAHPLAVQARDDGLAISGAAASASDNAIITPFEADLVVPLDNPRTEVTGYGAFSVDLNLVATSGSVRTTLTQGSPLLSLVGDGVPIELRTANGAVIEVDGSHATVTVGGRLWDVVSESELEADDGVVRSVHAGSNLTAALRPDEADERAWLEAVRTAAQDPVVTTAWSLDHRGDRGVIQTLHVLRQHDSAGPMALLPHQVATSTSVSTDAAILGTYRHARGSLQVVEAARLELEIDAGSDPTLGWPEVALDDQARAAIIQDLDADLADEPGDGGSYFGAKEVGRLATIVEIADASGAPDQRDAALERLRPLLDDWLSYDGPDDDRYVALDPTWGGVIAVPAEFGLEDYNDHHFQYGYLVRGAAILAEHDPGFIDDYGPVVDLLVDGYAPRVFQPWLGHSVASGFAPFVDGNNQESSSEAVASWEAAARWGAVAGRDDLVDLATALLAIEAETTRTYWLGEDPDVRPEGYAHITAGIIFDAKIDFATWFSADPEAIIGIQLIPLTAASDYRSDPEAARDRAREIEGLVGGPPRSWGDLFAADLAIADPDAARERIDAGVPREPSTSRAAVRYWIELQATRAEE